MFSSHPQVQWPSCVLCSQPGNSCAESCCFFSTCCELQSSLRREELGGVGKLPLVAAELHRTRWNVRPEPAVRVMALGWLVAVGSQSPSLHGNQTSRGACSPCRCHCCDTSGRRCCFSLASGGEGILQSVWCGGCLSVSTPDRQQLLAFHLLVVFLSGKRSGCLECHRITAG